MAVKDSKLEEKEQLVIKGTIFADEFCNRQTGKKIDEDPGDSFTSGEVANLKKLSGATETDTDGDVEFVGDLSVAGKIKNGTDEVSVADLAALITYAKAEGWIS